MPYEVFWFVFDCFLCLCFFPPTTSASLLRRTFIPNARASPEWPEELVQARQRFNEVHADTSTIHDTSHTCHPPFFFTYFFIPYFLHIFMRRFHALSSFDAGSLLLSRALLFDTGLYNTLVQYSYLRQYCNRPSRAFLRVPLAMYS